METVDVIVPRVSKTRGSALVKIGEFQVSDRQHSELVSKTRSGNVDFHVALPLGPVTLQVAQDASNAAPRMVVIDFSAFRNKGELLLSLGSMRQFPFLAKHPLFKPT